MGSSISSSSPLLHLLHLLLLLLLLGQFSNAALSSDGVDVGRVLPARTFLSHTLNAAPGSSSSWSSSSSSSFEALREDLEGEEAEEREEAHLSCITNNIESALLQAKITREKIDEFKDHYTRNKFNMTWADFNGIIPLEWDETVLEVCSVDQTCSTVLPSLPPVTTPPPATDNDAAKTLAEMSVNVLRFLSAYEQLFLDQIMNEDKFKKEMHEACINHHQLSTLLEEVLEACRLTANSDLAKLRGKMYVDTSSPQTDLRGFCTLRQSLQGLDLLESMFGEGVRLLENVVEEREDDEDEEEEEEVVHRRNRRKMKGGHSRRHGKNKKGNKRRKRRRNNLD